MRTPPGLSVASLRPWMISPPFSVGSTQSPCRHARPPPKLSSKYASLYFEPSPSSPKKASGAQGKALRQASSPCSPAATSASPASSKTATSRPSPADWSSASKTGSQGLPPWKDPLRSVPPDVEWSPTPGFWDASHAYADGGHGDPVEPTRFSSVKGGSVKSSAAHAPR